MARPKAMYYEILHFEPDNLALLGDHFDLIELPDPRHDSDQALAEINVYCAPLGYRVDGAKLDKCPRLRAILTNTTGVAHIDLAAAEARGIAVVSLKDEQAFLETVTPTAEHCWGLLLALMRRVPWSFEAVRQGRWNRYEFGGPAMLSRLSLGIIGYGRLGRMVACYGHGFGMQVRFHDPGKAGDEVAQPAASLAELVAWADVVSLHAPATDATHRLIDRKLFAAFKPASYFINTARGELVDEGALIEALIDGPLAGAAVDVLDGEFAPDFDAARHPLVRYAREHDNLLITPHIGGSTRDAWRETQRRVIDATIAHLAARKPA